MPVVNLFATFRQVSGTKSVRVQGSTVGEALQDLCRQHPGLRERLFAGDAIRPLVLISLNGRHIEHIDGLDTPLQPADEIALFPPLGGGALASHARNPIL